MGLDLVEVVMRTEEVFGISLPDEECSLVRTVGDLYRLVLEKLDLCYSPPIAEESGAAGDRPTSLRHHYAATANQSDSSHVPSPTWTAADVWRTLKALLQDQLQVDASEIKEQSSFAEDLGAD